MPKINEAFPSKYLKAADLEDRQHLMVMERAEFEMLGDERKLILYFQNQKKGLVLNKTNANTIAAKYGDDTEDWLGKEIVLFEAMVDFQGKTGPAIRVRAPKAKAAKAAAINHECLLIGARRAKEGGWIFSIRTHSDDPPGLELLPLNQRFALAAVPLKDAE
jgi:hypothetical protein